ncbi:F0F1 ATP synthase subunit B [Hyphobacterium sp. CCMP332]|nr:F0F1 ATP synthase subunit B [Hyphobacterium sp. CCMP332]
MDLLTPGTGLIFWQALTFLIVVFLLGRFAWKPILSALETREHSIEEALRSAEIAKEEMEKLQASNEKLLQEARIERDQIIKDAQAAAATIRDEAKVQAEESANKIMVDAKAEIEQQKNSAISEVKNLVADLSLDIAEKILRKELADKKSQENLIKDYVKEIKLN